MRDRTDGLSASLVGVSASVLIVAVLLSGCASKGARHESSLYPKNHYGSGARSQLAAARAPAPVPAVRGFNQRLGNNGKPPVLINDERRYSAVYGVPARPDYLDTPVPETGVATEALPPIQYRQPAPKRRVAEANFNGPRLERRIVVTRGDTLHNLAWRYKTTITALLRANRLRHGNIEIGQELIIPASR